MTPIHSFQKIVRSLSTTPSTPGLHIFENFLPQDLSASLKKESIRLHRAITGTHPQVENKPCKTFLSQYHNLSSDEYYRLVVVPDKMKERITGQHFEAYGEQGHKLTYFIGQSNLPSALKQLLIPRILELPPVKAITANKQIDWNFTFNTYAVSKQERSDLPGFGYHKDIKSNGIITMIYSIGTSALFQIRHPQNKEYAETILINDNSLVLLSNEARWDYEHRIVHGQNSHNQEIVNANDEIIKRISLVLGVATFEPI